MNLIASRTLDRPVHVATPRGPARPRARRGSLLAEVGIATVVLLIVMGMTVRVLATVAQERRAASDCQRGILEAGNLMERITAHDFDEVTPDFVRKIAVSESARRALRDPELSIEVGSGPAARGSDPRSE